MDFKERKKAAKQIAKDLKERNWQFIARVIEFAGIDFAQNILEQTRKVQADGGMMTLDNKRKRTAGGVFFRLAKEQLSDELRKQVFPPKNWKALKAKEKAEKEAKAAQETSTQPVEASATPTETPVPEPQDSLSEPADKLAQLEEAAQTLRERIAEMEAKGQKGVKMTKTLLANTEKQIEKLQSV